MDRKTAIEKIKKCIALAKSANEYEAAVALRQAQVLMEKFGVEDDDILMSEVCKDHAKAGSKAKPVQWESWLAVTVAKAFGCETIFSRSISAGWWVFIGCGPAPEIATYAYRVLLRQLKKARSDFQKRECKRLVPASRIRRADLFCEGWVNAVACKIDKFVGNQRNADALAAYMAKQYPELNALAVRDRQAGKSFRDGDNNAHYAGWQSGKEAQLNHGICGSPEQQLAIGQ